MASLASLLPEFRPREKALSHGLESLNEAELLALVISSGIPGASALEIAVGLLGEHHGLANLSSAPLTAYQGAKGLGVALSLRLAASFELGRRLQKKEAKNRKSALGPQDYAKAASASLSLEKRESLLLFLLDKKGRIKLEKKMYLGTEKGMLISPSEIVKEAIKSEAPAFLLAHNHPSGLLIPSQADIKATLELSEQAARMSLSFHDHLLVGEAGFFSFKEAGLL